MPSPLSEAMPKARFLRPVGLLTLIVLADLLFWDHSPGLSVAIFALAVYLVATADIRVPWRPALLLLVCALPVVEHLQPLSLAFLGLGLVTSLVWARQGAGGIWDLAARAAGFLGHLPLRWLEVLILPRTGHRLAVFGRQTFASGPQKLLRDWGFPLAGTLVFASLLMQANPVFARLLTVQIDLWETFSRILFWLGMVLFVLPFLARDLPAPLGLPQARSLPLERLGLNAASVLRALVLFNLSIGLQTVSDLSILLGGAALPPGMTYAAYAHRGAYPLLATALLAGAFALAARSHLGNHPAIKPLMLLWIAQNLVLCGAAMLRLDHYIAAYGLTYLRAYALIWMALVAAGLGLMFWQMLRQRSNLWFLRGAAGLGVATLYASCFVNFAAGIAAQNLGRDRFDMAYLCALGPMAQAPLVKAIETRPLVRNAVLAQGWCTALRPFPAPDWRDWGFRSARVHAYVAQVQPLDATR